VRGKLRLSKLGSQRVEGVKGVPWYLAETRPGFLRPGASGVKSWEARGLIGT